MRAGPVMIAAPPAADLNVVPMLLQPADSSRYVVPELLLHGLLRDWVAGRGGGGLGFGLVSGRWVAGARGRVWPGWFRGR